MDLPKFAPRREIDLYVYQKNEINRTLEQFSKRLHAKPSNTVKSPDKKSQDIFSVVHGIGPDGCAAAAAINLKMKQMPFNSLLDVTAPLIELWEGLPTLHFYISWKPAQKEHVKK